MSISVRSECVLVIGRAGDTLESLNHSVVIESCGRGGLDSWDKIVEYRADRCILVVKFEFVPMEEVPWNFLMCISKTGRTSET